MRSRRRASRISTCRRRRLASGARFATRALKENVMYAVEYRQPASLAEAVGLLGSTGGRPLAGGQSLVAAMKLRLSQPGTLVDLDGIAELKGIRRDSDRLAIGA